MKTQHFPFRACREINDWSITSVWPLIAGFKRRLSSSLFPPIILFLFLDRISPGIVPRAAAAAAAAGRGHTDGGGGGGGRSVGRSHWLSTCLATFWLGRGFTFQSDAAAAAAAAAATAPRMPDDSDRDADADDDFVAKRFPLSIHCRHFGIIRRQVGGRAPSTTVAVLPSSGLRARARLPTRARLQILNHVKGVNDDRRTDGGNDFAWKIHGSNLNSPPVCPTGWR